MKHRLCSLAGVSDPRAPSYNCGTRVEGPLVTGVP